MTRHSRRCRAGLTLIEVLAAVAVLGVGYIAVIQAGSEGLLREGETRRYLEASLIADQALFELEFDLDAGLIPEADTREVDGYELEIEISPVALTVAPPERNAPVEVANVDQNSLLGGSRPTKSPLRRVELWVRWQEGFSERAVSRITFAFDPSSALGVLDALAASTESGGAEGGREGEPGGEDQGTPVNPNRPNPNDAEGAGR